jgi:hypothetical protein
VPQNPASLPAESPFRLQLSLADLVEHRGWRHARAQALDALERGESVALLGPSGTGKTLLLRSIAQALEGLGRHVATAGAAGPLDAPSGADILLVDEAGTRSTEDLARLAASGPPFLLAALPGFAPRLAELPGPVVRVALEKLAPAEIEGLVAARLAAGGRPRDMFAPEALQALARHSGGRLRLVLVLAGAALFVAEREGAPRVGADHVDDAAEMRGVAVDEASPAELEPESTPPPPPPAPAPLAAPLPAPLPAPARLRLGSECPLSERGTGRRSRAGAWWRRVTVGMAAAGLVVGVGAALLAPHVATPPRTPPFTLAEAPPAAPEPAPPPISPAPEPAPLVANVPAPPPAVPTAPVPPDVPEPAPQPEPAPEHERRADPPAPAPRPRAPVASAPPAPPGVPRPPQARLAPLPDAPAAVPLSPWWVERSTPAAPPPGDLGDGARIIARERANIRGSPNPQSPVVRVVSEGTELRVFGRRGPWLHVGDSFAWGWIKVAVVERAP